MGTLTRDGLKQGIQEIMPNFFRESPKNITPWETSQLNDRVIQFC